MFENILLLINESIMGTYIRVAHLQTNYALTPSSELMSGIYIS